MDRLLRAVVLGFGMLFGIIRPEAPAVSCRVYRDDAAVFLNAEATRAFPPEALQLLESGNELSLEFRVAVGGYKEWTFFHSLRYDPLSGIHTVAVGDTGGVHRTDSREAALSIASRVTGMRLMDLGGFDPERGISVSVACALQSPGIDAAALWNYGTPEARAAFADLNRIPR